MAFPLGGGVRRHLFGTKVADTNDGLCDADCSFREGVGAANASPGGDVIEIPASLGPIVLTLAGSGPEDGNHSGDLDVWDAAGGTLVLRGMGGTAIVRTTLPDRILHVLPGTAVPDVVLEDLDLQDGVQHPVVGGAGGGCVAYEGVTGTLTLTRVAFRNCRSIGLPATHTAIPVLAGGGAVYAAGALQVVDSSFLQNIAEYEPGGAIYALGDVDPDGVLLEGNTTTVPMGMCSGCTQTYPGGALWVSGSGVVDVADSTVRVNWADQGGGLYVDGAARFTLTSSVISMNEARGAAGGTGDGQGGGLWISADEVEIAVSEVAENEVGGGFSYGGGLFVVAPLAGASPALNQTSWVRNVAKTGGGGVYIENRPGAGGQMTIRNSTFSENLVTAFGSGGGGLGLVSGSAGGLTDLFLQHVTFYNNSATVSGHFQSVGVTLSVDVLNSYFFGGACSGTTITTSGGNAHDNATCLGGTASSSDPWIGSGHGPNTLGYYGGTITRVHTLVPTRAGFDDAPCSTAIPVDQHGKPRPVGPQCESGAWEQP